jgi:hypothetical protein
LISFCFVFPAMEQQSLLPPLVTPLQQFLGHRNGYIDVSTGNISEQGKATRLRREIGKRIDCIAHLEVAINKARGPTLASQLKMDQENKHHELGFLIGARLAYKIRTRERRKDVKVGPRRKRINWLDWKEELKELQHIVVHRVLKKQVVEAIAEELNALESIREGLITDEFCLAVYFEGKEATSKGVELDKCPCLSGFLDGLKECMSVWLSKVYTDVSVVSSLPHNFRRKERPLHYDVELRDIQHYKEEDARWPVSIYFSLFF